MTNQRERALEALAVCDIEALENVVAEAQNEPPLGVADGSIPAELWRLLRDVASTGRRFMQLSEQIEAWGDLAISRKLQDGAGKK